MCFCYSAIAYETITDAQDSISLSTQMSEVAGCLAVVESAAHSPANKCGRCVLISSVSGTDLADVVIICGVVGTNAAKIAVGMGVHVMIFAHLLIRLCNLNDICGNLSLPVIRLLRHFARHLSVQIWLLVQFLFLGQVLLGRLM